MEHAGQRRQRPEPKARTAGTAILGALFPREQWKTNGGDAVSTAVMTPKVHAERVVTLVNQSLQLFIVANDENYALAA